MRKEIKLLEHHPDILPDFLDLLEIIIELNAVNKNFSLLVLF